MIVEGRSSRSGAAVENAAAPANAGESRTEGEEAARPQSAQGAHAEQEGSSTEEPAARESVGAPAVPPVEVLMSEVVASLALAAHAYLHPAAGEAGSSPDLGAAEIAIDVAGAAYERITPRLGAAERSAIASMLTDLRFTYVKKRGT